MNAVEQLEALRVQHQVRLVNEQEEGTGLHRLPNGVYGHTYAPGREEAPLFRVHKLQSFEVHKLGDATAVLVGFVSPAQAGEIQRGEPLAFRLRPEPAEDADTLVSIPLWQIRRHQEHSARDGRGLEIELIGGRALE